MSMKKIPLDQATREELLAFAEIQNIDIDGRVRDTAKIRAAIEPVLAGRTEIEIPAAMASSEGEAPAVLAKKAVPLAEQDWSYPDACYIEITIAKDQNPGGNQPVGVQVNGKKMFIERGKKQPVRYPYYYALMKAEYVMHEQQTDPAEPLGNAVSVPRYMVVTHTPVPDHVMR